MDIRDIRDRFVVMYASPPDLGEHGEAFTEHHLRHVNDSLHATNMTRRTVEILLAMIADQQRVIERHRSEIDRLTEGVKATGCWPSE